MFTVDFFRTHRFSVMLLAILIAAFAVYANTLFNEFVYDDMMQVLQNPWITDVSFLPDIFSKSVWGFHGGQHSSSNYYRPLMNVILMVDYHMFGLRPWGFHLINVILHAANSLLVFLLVAKLFPSHRYPLAMPFVAALIFAVHPVHSEAVAWVCGITDISFTLFLLLALYFYILSNGTYGKHYVFSQVFFSLSLLSKEPAIVFPLILIAYEVTFGKRGEPVSLRAKRMAPYIGVAGLYLVGRVVVLGGFAPLGANQGYSFYERVLNMFPLFMQYLEKLVLPINLNAFHQFVPVVSLADPKAIVGLIVTLLFIAVTVVAFKKNRPVFFCLVLIALPLLPALQIKFLGESALAERYLYCPSLGFAVLLSLGSDYFAEKRQEYTAIIMAILLLLTGLYSLKTIRRNAVWRTNSSLYADMVKSSPDSEFPLNNLAGALMAEGHVDRAIEVYQSITERINPNSDRAHYNLGTALEQKGLPSEAATAYEKSLSLNPESIFADQIHFKLGRIYLDSQDIEKAVGHLRMAVRLQQENPYYHNMLGIAYGKKGWYDQAIAEFQVSIRLAPNEPSWQMNLQRAMRLKPAAARRHVPGN
jgi:protein O-mannosyl-transferase